ncbi:MAG: DUF4959 domain-containing protein [Dysgonamonadaceae bacterium]|jgi:hypothetical protein|nr:DUF4959 domain-containing protein [Dysgonamonadaceae bacterium]
MGRRNLKQTLLLSATSIVLLGGCAEGERFKQETDAIPPEKPIFLWSEPLNGGARIYYSLPTDDDVLGIEASYTTEAGKVYSFLAYYTQDAVDVYGFGTVGKHPVSLRTIDRAGNKSETIVQTVDGDSSVIDYVKETMALRPSFEAFFVQWKNILQKQTHVSANFSYTENGSACERSVVFTSRTPEENQVIKGLPVTPETPVKASMQVEDVYGNSASMDFGTINLLSDRILPKENWKLLPADTIMGGYRQANGSQDDGQMYEVIDDKNDSEGLKNCYVTRASVPWNIIIDLGAEYELSRIVMHQRYTYDGSVRGAYYRADNVRSFNLYIWNEKTAAWLPVLTGAKVETPSIARMDEDYVKWGNAGDMFYIYPNNPGYTPRTRYVCYMALSGKYISEITLYGK